jgi:hypothetical protein
MATLYQHEKWIQARVTDRDPQLTLRYTAAEVADYDDLSASVLAQSPGTFEGLARLDWSGDPLGPSLYSVSVSYGLETPANPAISGNPLGTTSGGEAPIPPSPPFDGQGDSGEPPTSTEEPPSEATDENEHIGPDWGFSTTGGTVHVTRSLATVSTVTAPGEVARNFRRAIGVDPATNQVAGVDITARKMTLTYTAKYKFVTLKFIRDICKLTGKVNNAPWFIFQAGEILFLGAEGKYTFGEGWVFTFHFDYAENVTDLEVSDEITVPTKMGHDYIWVWYRDVNEGSVVTAKPGQAYVEQLYKQGDFSKLGF